MKPFQTESETEARPALRDDGVWKELGEARKNDLLTILRLLVEFDERSGRAAASSEPELHWLRKAMACALDAEVRFFLKPVGGFVFYVVAELSASGGRAATSWVHEDGVQAEREIWAGRQHPVHGILCLTDLYARYSQPVPLDLEPEGPGDFALDLMLDDSLYNPASTDEADDIDEDDDEADEDDARAPEERPQPGKNESGESDSAG